MQVQTIIDDDTSYGRIQIGEMLRNSLVKVYECSQKFPDQFIREKKIQLLEVDAMSMAKNGDMVRPQVKAVIDMLLSGIEIDSDFSKGNFFIFFTQYKLRL